MPDDFRENDPFSPIRYVYEGAQEVHASTSPHQRIRVLRHPYFGAMLVLDDVVQLTERDEFFYHELLVHVPMHAHPRPQEVLILGGGDGGSLREVLKHEHVDAVTLVEIDAQVIETCRRFLPTVASGFADPRTRVVHADGGAYLRASRERFDVIIVDAPDPTGPAGTLFAEDTLRSAEQRLGDNGVLALQTESLHFHRPFVVQVQRRLEELFPVVGLYAQAIATYAGAWWTFSVGSKGLSPTRPQRRTSVVTRYYSPEVHRRAFLPRALRRRLLQDQLDW